jgi:DnaK suppressor protein
LEKIKPPERAASCQVRLNGGEPLRYDRSVGWKGNPLRPSGPENKEETAMNKVRLKRYRAVLSEQLHVLLNHNEGTVIVLEDDTQSHADPNDRATAESGRSFDLRLRDRDRKLIGKIKAALERIDEGTFGICEDCGQAIEEKRLEVRPVTSQCIECKEDQERRERRERPPVVEAAVAVPVAAVRRHR